MAKEYEGLQLSDLKFDESGQFDVFKNKEGGTNQIPNIKKPGDEQNKTTDGEGKVIEKPNSESVANGKELNQGKDGKTTEGSNSSSPQPNANEKLFASLAAGLKSKGVLPNLDLEKANIKSLEDINKAIQAEVTGRLGDKQIAIAKAMELGLDTGAISEQLDTISKLKSIPPDFINKEGNDDWRKSVIAQDFLNKGIEKTRADVMAQRAIDAGTGAEDATVALEAIIQREEDSYEGKIKDAQDAEKKDVDDIKAFINKDEEILPGIKLDSQQIEEIYNKITTDLGNKENAFIQAQKKDPIGSRIKLETLFHLTKGLTDFSIFSQSGAKKANDNFEQLLQGSSFSEESGGGSGFESGNDENFTLKDLADAGLKFE